MDIQKQGELLIELRKRKGLSQVEFAKSLHISPSTLCKWEKGKGSPDIGNLQMLADIFELTIDDLLHPEKTLSQLHGEIIYDEKSDTSPVNIHKNKKIKLIAAFICSVIILSMAFVVYWNHSPHYKIQNSYHEENEYYGSTYVLEILCNSVGLEESERYLYSQKIRQQWEEGTFPTDVNVLYLHLYSDKNYSSDSTLPEIIIALFHD